MKVRDLDYEVVGCAYYFAMFVSHLIYTSVMFCCFSSSGSFGVYVPVNSKDRYMIEFYGKLGFLELCPGFSPDTIYVGRTF